MGPGFSVRSALSVFLSWGVAPREMRFCRGTFFFFFFFDNNVENGYLQRIIYIYFFNFQFFQFSLIFEFFRLQRLHGGVGWWVSPDGCRSYDNFFSQIRKTAEERGGQWS